MVQPTYGGEGMATHALVLRPRRRLSTGIERIVSAVLVALGVVLAILVLFTVVGRCAWLVERSDSMAPALRAGDLLAVQRIDPAAARPGDIVTFKEPSRPGILLTHRVVSVRRDGGVYHFTTRGDANTGSENWAVKADGTIGRTVVRVPAVGRLVVLLGTPHVRFVLLTIASLLLAVELLRRIWSKQERAEPAEAVAAPAERA
jgi:signal peptidase